MTKIDQKRVFDLKKRGLTAFSLVIELAYQVWAISDMQWPEIFWFFNTRCHTLAFPWPLGGEISLHGDIKIAISLRN